MASIQSIQSILTTYQQVYGASALQEQIQTFLKGAASPSVEAPKASSASSDSSLSSLTSQQLRDIWADLTGRKSGLKSSGKFSTKPLLIAEIERLRSAPAAASDSASVASAAPSAESKKRSGPSAWNAFVEHVSGKGKVETPEFAAWKSAQPEGQKGNLRFSFAKSLGKGALEEFKKTYVPTEVSDSGSVASSTESKPKAKRAPKMTAEEKAAAKEAKKEAKKAERQAAKEAKKAAKKAERAAAKAAKKAEGAPPALPASLDDGGETATSEAEYTEIELGGTTYFWDSDSGYFYEREEDGSLNRVGTFDGATYSFGA